MTDTTSPAFSLEFFPPRDIAAQERLVRAAKQMLAIQPRYVSVTFGAGGSTRAGTEDTVRTLTNLGCDAAPHLSCIGASREQLREILNNYRQAGVRRVVALRGDLPSGMGGDAGELRYASELVRFIREETGDWFHIEVAAYPEIHPQAASPTVDLDHFVAKVQAGADAAITQYFFNADAYFDFVDRAQARGVSIPIVPGIMPITNYSQLSRFSEMCGAELPRWIRLRLAEFGDDKASIRAFGQDVVTELCQTLLDTGVPGLHFYTLNQSEAILGIWKNLQR
ncbi:methylenetetrahydrofolate reductase [NAD(P)H] [Bordetella holmesii]|uniref:Methylenetetrahydrofolate reductase n=1 Tax=Bordetella holmesii CDC-H585-BH TaxID=1331206 RepID=A0A158M0C5_9BORD|nr:methylenetetrahydrofolate reductase [NAD(P)H] [Bordetella holmesii]AHV93290.1 5,10-methylenetetrahydrofolate reductase [Bordetella holmesii ATCC 51541]AIT25922.1 5,10-methylenetetrahydrofolate reductase [Bordetella holmesii 44057]EWM42501.1 5,10-methylenetetrahydrofolate reductase [Bordetella holmesii 41130]EWM46491.1 5,10-methylenetetrahydrofolate reductase [Bordetella holmesii 35009]EWM50657.1 5,10-methylenetetrahydrofolate reductase [Bordetella holmesii 70147]